MRKVLFQFLIFVLVLISSLSFVLDGVNADACAYTSDENYKVWSNHVESDKSCSDTTANECWGNVPWPSGYDCTEGCYSSGSSCGPFTCNVGGSDKCYIACCEKSCTCNPNSNRDCSGTPYVSGNTCYYDFQQTCKSDCYGYGSCTARSSDSSYADCLGSGAVSGSTCYYGSQSNYCTNSGWTCSNGAAVNCDAYDDLSLTYPKNSITDWEPGACSSSCSGQSCCTSTTFECNDELDLCNTATFEGNVYTCYHNYEEDTYYIQTTPLYLEQEFLPCTDGKNNDCIQDTDYLDEKCQIDCNSGYEELLRYNDTNIYQSYVIDPDLMSETPDKYQYYFPLCVQAEGLTTDCSIEGTIPVLRYDSNTETVASNATSGPGIELVNINDFNEEFCMNSVDCYVSDACDSTHTAIASMSQEFNATLGHPDTGSDKKLCCSMNQVGIQFDNGPAIEKIECNVISDGFCPEDVEDVNGNRVSCAIYHDPDCGFGARWYRSDLFRKPDFMLTFAERNYVLGTENSDSARVSVYNETDIQSESEYLYQFAITSDLDSEFSTTVIEFSYGDIPEVSFDGFTIEECSSTPIRASDLDNLTEKACYEWDNPAILTLYHTLSDHEVGVKFNYSSFGVLIFVLLIFAIALPIALVKKANISLKLTINKKDDLEHHIKTLAKEEKELEEYIKKAFDKGLPKSKIQATLLSAGWDRTDIDRIIKRVRK